MKRTLLSEAQIHESLARLQLWQIKDKTTLSRTFLFPDFRAALSFVNLVGELAEQQDHHPDINLRWNRVELSLTTHSAGGLTAFDFRLAESIDRIAL
jgi:4a-hydroxytetrahydrobiopterin dehydratase